MSLPRLQAWERAEIGRSAAEASQANSAKLIADESQVLRYINPPADSYYPLEYAYHLLGDVQGSTVLEYGCGKGSNTLVLARLGARVLALDISPALIAIARRRLAANHIAADVEFIVGSAHDLPLPDNSVDVVFGIAILHHLDLAVSAREVKRVLRKGGRAIFQEPVQNSALIRELRKLIPYRAPDVSPFERPLTDKELAGYGEGFSLYRSTPFTLPTTNFVYVVPWLRRRFIHTFNRLDGAILRRFPSLGYYSTVRVAKMIK